MSFDSLRAHFNNKENPFLKKLLLLFCLGAALLLGSTFFDSLVSQTSRGDEESEGPSMNFSYTKEAEEWSHEESLERRLSDVLSLVNGAGQVEVMLTLSGSREIILAEDVVLNESHLRETDAGGGTRENQSLSKDTRTILISGHGQTAEPIVVREILPRVEGVIIVAEGGDDVFVREALMRAATTVLGVDIHRVQVLTRKPTQ
jgi:stage III sporulation protein AG